MHSRHGPLGGYNARLATTLVNGTGVMKLQGNGPTAAPACCLPVVIELGWPGVPNETFRLISETPMLHWTVIIARSVSAAWLALYWSRHLSSRIDTAVESLAD